LIAGRCSKFLPEVCVFFNDRLIRGNRSTKVDSIAIGAFDSPNFAPLAKMGTDLTINEQIILPIPKGRFGINTDLETRIMVIKLVPGFVDFDIITNSDIRGIVLLLYGTGNAPARKAGFIKWIRALIERDIIVVACSQCLRGTVVLEDYAVGKQLHDAGVISAVDMTCEAAVTKMAYLLPMNLSKDKLGSTFQTSLRGELSAKHEHSDFIKQISSKGLSKS
jgi:L-asparaginase